MKQETFGRDSEADTSLRLGYIVFSFPQLSETFISDEVSALKSLGVDVTIFTLEPPRAPSPLVKEVKVNVPSVDCSLPSSNLRRFLLLIRLFPLAARRPVGFIKAAVSALPSFKKIVCLNFLQAGKVAQYLRGNEFDLLYGGFADQPATVAMFAAAFAGVRFSFAGHSGRDTCAEAVLLKTKIKRAAFVRTATRYIKKNLAKRFGHTGKLIALHCGIVLHQFPNARRRRQASFTVLSVGNLVEPKGFPYLLRAARELKDRGMGFRCVLVGDGPQRRYLEDLRVELEVGDVVAFVGALSRAEVKELLKGAAVFVLPCVPIRGGYMDSSPVAIKEAMACGVPVVSTDISGIPEAVKEGAGILVPPRDPAALAAAIKEVYDDWRNGGRKFTGGRRVVEKEFDLEKNVASLAGEMLNATRRGDKH